MSIKLMSFVLIGMLAAGCAKKSTGTYDGAAEGQEQPGPNPDPDPNPDPNPDPQPSTGASAPFSFRSAAIYNDYTNNYYGITDLGVLGNVQIKVNLSKFDNSGTGTGTGTAVYGGSFSITYDDYKGKKYEGKFSSGTNAIANRYNVFFPNPVVNIPAKAQVWHGFFQDNWGGMVLVIDGVTAFPVAPNTLVTGSVWYKNFDTYISNISNFCWFQTALGFECRSWLVNNQIQTTKALLPDNGYRKLGEFQNLNVNNAFNNQLPLQ